MLSAFASLIFLKSSRLTDVKTLPKSSEAPRNLSRSDEFSKVKYSDENCVSLSLYSDCEN
jgi:hypothetical protein